MNRLVHAKAPETLPRGPCHTVQFYGNETSLYETVSGFLGVGLERDEPGVVFATAEHRAAFEDLLAERRIDVDRAKRTGKLVMLDAREALDAFVTGDTPDPVAFRRHVGAALERTPRGRPDAIVRAYGEMVDLLWQEGRTDAAIRVELLWNVLASSCRFALLCGYSMGSFYKETERLDEVCQLHSHVVQTEGTPGVVHRRVGYTGVRFTG